MRGVLLMDDDDNVQKEFGQPDIIVCDLGILDWLELASGTVLVDYKYIIELQRKCGG
jgi:hypothetical protein